MSAEDMLDAALDLSEAEHDRLWNRVAEHEDGEHTTSWDGCPVCEGNIALAVAVWGSVSIECPNPDCQEGKIILNPEWPNGTEPYCENCSECGGMGTVEADE